MMNKILKIAVIDDNKITVQNITKFLNRSYNDMISINGFYDSVIAFDNIITNRYDIIITDNIMPRYDGIYLIEEVYKVYRPYTILVSSSTRLTIVRKSGLFDCRLEKPLKFEKLKEATNKAMKCIEERDKITLEETTDEVISELNFKSGKQKLFFKDIILGLILHSDEDEKNTYKILGEHMQKNPSYLSTKVSNLVDDVYDKESFTKFGFDEKPRKKPSFIRRLANIIKEKAFEDCEKKVVNK